MQYASDSAISAFTRAMQCWKPTTTDIGGKQVISHKIEQERAFGDLVEVQSEILAWFK
jgi:hypothetical protein